MTKKYFLFYFIYKKKVKNNITFLYYIKLLKYRIKI